MATALVGLATTTLASASATVTFSSISGAYRDLRIILHCSHSADNEVDLNYRFNGDSGSNYTRVAMTGNGSSAGSFATGPDTELQLLQGSTTLSVATTDIMDYSATDKHKTVLARGNLTSGRVSAFAGRWASTAAITSISITPRSGGTFTTGSTFSLYGIVS